MENDPRLAAFCSPKPEVFHSVAHRHEIWCHDPLDVEVIHGEARTEFERLVQRATTPPGLPSGRIMVLLGESGAGKTHLMRAFRTYVHGRRLGYVGYMQMTSQASSYARYALINLIDSLDKPYDHAYSSTSGLMRLSNALAESPGVSLERLERLREEDLEAEALQELVFDVANEVLVQAPFEGLDDDVIRALLYLQRDDPRLKSRILKYLRCEDLANVDRKLVDLVPKSREEDPQRVIELLGRMMWATDHSSLVLCIDQFEPMYEDDEASRQRFRQAMTTVCELADRVPSSVVVISCLEDYYTKLRGCLTRSVVDRLERDPKPIRLESRRSEVEAELLVIQRLQSLYESLDAPFRDDDPTYPFDLHEVRGCAGMRTRDVLDWCREFQKRCMRAGGIPSEAPPAAISESGRWRPIVDAPGPEPVDTTALEQAWNDFRSLESAPPPDDEGSLVELLSWAIRACGEERTDPFRFDVKAANKLLDIELLPEPHLDWRLTAALCERSPKGGGLGRQIARVEEEIGDRRLVVLRSTDFPSDPRTKIAKQLGRLIARGGRRVVVEDSDWRAMQALRAFCARHAGTAGLAVWRRDERPLSQLPSLRAMLALDELNELEEPRPGRATPPTPRTDDRGPAEAPEVATPERGASGRAPAAAVDGAVVLGTAKGLRSQPVLVQPDELTRHAAFLGGTGSGKTTLAMNLLEQLLLAGTPALLVDRKGDLCGYGSAGAWDALPASPRKDEFLSRVDVRVYTPGHPGGRDLGIPAVPSALGRLQGPDRERMASFVAQAIGGMMSYGGGRRDSACLAILVRAISLLGELQAERSIGLPDLIEFVGGPDPSLVNAIGRLDTKNLDRLTDDLETLRLSSGRLLSGQGDDLDLESLLGRGPDAVPGRTRLSIVSTKFLGDNQAIQFWVSQLLMRVVSWTSRHPSAALQAALLLDEADLYLPASSKPATKEPIEHLLKRARSAGLAVLLATQNPGDLDYRCRDTIRTWFVGRVKEGTALRKMKPMLSSCPTDVTGRIPTQAPGEFHILRDGEVTAFTADRSLLALDQLAEAEILEVARSGLGRALHSL